MDSNTTGIPATATSAVSASVVSTTGNTAASTIATAAANAKQASTTTTPAKQAPELQRDPRSLQFQVDGNRVITTIVDENNNTVVVQIPDADMIRIAKAIDRMQGFLVQEKA